MFRIGGELLSSPVSGVVYRIVCHHARDYLGNDGVWSRYDDKMMHNT